MKSCWALLCAIALLSACASPQPANSSAWSNESAEAQARARAHAEWRAELDRLPDNHRDVVRRYRAMERERVAAEHPAALAVYFTEVQWNQSVVTVAFNGGDPTTWSMIEAAVEDWTRHSEGHFAFSFKDENGAYRQWSWDDRDRAADIRIAFEDDGNWSLVGRMANAADVNASTMNLARLPQRIAENHYDTDTDAWNRSYSRSTILHEFGHALGLSHEHFHPQCQRDLILDPESGYRRNRDENGYYIPRYGRSPGAILWHGSYWMNWPAWKAEFNLDADVYFDDTYQSVSAEFPDTDLTITDDIDRWSIMLYDFPAYLMVHGTNSPCWGLYNTPDQWFATNLSDGDIAYFRSYYARPLPRQPDQP